MRARLPGMAGTVHLEIDGAIATLVNDNPDKHNAFDDDMDDQLFAALGELAGRSDIRAVIWRGVGASWSSGRDVSSIGNHTLDMSHHELMSRGHRGIQQTVGHRSAHHRRHRRMGDRRIVPAGAAVRHPHLHAGRDGSCCPRSATASSPTPAAWPCCTRCAATVWSATWCSPAGASAPTRPSPTASCLASSNPTSLDATAREMADKIAAAPPLTVKLARRVISHLARPPIRASMDDELIYQTFLNRSDDAAELRTARAEGRSPRFVGS